MKKRLIDFYPELLTEATKGDMRTRGLAGRAVAKVFGKQVGMINKDTVVDGQRQIWIDLTWPSTELDAQQDPKGWMKRKAAKLEQVLRSNPNTKNFDVVYRERLGNLNVVLVRDE